MKTLSLEEYDALLTKWNRQANSKLKRYSKAAVFLSCELVFVLTHLNPDASLEEIREEIGRLIQTYATERGRRE